MPKPTRVLGIVPEDKQRLLAASALLQALCACPCGSHVGGTAGDPGLELCLPRDRITVEAVALRRFVRAVEVGAALARRLETVSTECLLCSSCLVRTFRSRRESNPTGLTPARTAS